MLLELVRGAAEHARHVKTARCAEEGRVDILPMVEILRGGKPVSLSFLMPSLDTMYRDIALLIEGFDADAVIFTVESYRRLTKADKNPATGEDWGPGAYQDLAENHDGLAKGWVEESLMTFGANRAGDVVAAEFPYHFEGDEPTFGAMIEMGAEPDHRLGGRVPEMLVEVMNRSGVSAAFLREAGVAGLPDRDERDIVVARILAGQINGQVGLLAFSDDEGRESALKTAVEAHPAFFRTYGTA